MIPQAMGIWWQLGKDAPSRPNGGLEEVALSLRRFGAAELDQHADVSTATQAGNYALVPGRVLRAALGGHGDFTCHMVAADMVYLYSQYPRQDGGSPQSSAEGVDALHELREDIRADLVAADAQGEPDDGHRQNDADMAVALRMRQLQLISEARHRRCPPA